MNGRNIRNYSHITQFPFPDFALTIYSDLRESESNKVLKNKSPNGPTRTPCDNAKAPTQ